MRPSTIRFALLCALLATALPPHAHAQGRAAAAQAAPGATTVVVIRHAEKADDDPRDPTLTAAGERRAQALLGVLQDADVAAIYSTQLKRTRATVDPLARQLRLPVTVREIAPGQADRYARELAREILATHAGRSVVVVGHSNTVPQIVRALSGRTVAEMTEQEYDHLFVVVVPAQGAPRLFRTRYGVVGGR
jgi:broad specificity phosphatase PhoE